MCDTSFLMHMATRRVRNIDRLGEEMGGDVEFVVPGIVLDELERIAGSGGSGGRGSSRGRGSNNAKRADARQTIKFARRLKVVPAGGTNPPPAAAATAASSTLAADDAIVEYAAGRRRGTGPPPPPTVSATAAAGANATAAGIIVATMDRQLKRRLRECGCSIMSFSNDNIVLEPPS